MDKRLFILFSLLVLCISVTVAQEVKVDKPLDYKVVMQREAQYEKGEKELYKYVYERVNYIDSLRHKLSDKEEIIIGFDVLYDSTLTNFEIIKTPDDILSNEIVKVLKGVKFLPAVVNGRVIKSHQMIVFPTRIFK